MVPSHSSNHSNFIMAKKKTLNSIDLLQFRTKTATHKNVQVKLNILIVCEGEKTEPLYFKNFNNIVMGNWIYTIDCKGGRMNTVQVVKKAIELRNKAKEANKPYDSVWAVFDKDDFPDKDFNDAIRLAENNDIGCAWSNEAFELWYVLHFENRTSQTGRNDYKSLINKHINKAKPKGEKQYEYEKNDGNIGNLLQKYGNEEKAIDYAEALDKSYVDNAYSRHNPCTTVYKLVKMLRGKDKKFIDKLKKDMNKKTF